MLVGCRVLQLGLELLDHLQALPGLPHTQAMSCSCDTMAKARLGVRLSLVGHEGQDSIESRRRPPNLRVTIPREIESRERPDRQVQFCHDIRGRSRLSTDR